MPGAHSIPGGIFPPPPSIGGLLAQLPHPSCFRGPFVAADDLMNLFRTAQLNVGPKPEGLQGEKGKKYFEISDSGVNNNTTGATGGITIKRQPDDDDDADGDGSNLAPPQFDIYRSRQLQKRPKI